MSQKGACSAPTAPWVHGARYARDSFGLADIVQRDGCSNVHDDAAIVLTEQRACSQQSLHI